MHSFEQQNQPNFNTQKSISETMQDKMSTSLIQALTDNPETLHHVTIFPGMGINTCDKINEVLKHNGLQPLKLVLSCGFIYKAQINLKAAEELAVLEAVHSIYEDWSAQSFFD